MSSSIVMASTVSHKHYDSHPQLPNGDELVRNCIICGREAQVATDEEKAKTLLVCSKHLGR